MHLDHVAKDSTVTCTIIYLKMATEHTLANWYLALHRLKVDEKELWFFDNDEKNLHAKWRRRIHKASFNQPTDYDDMLQREAETDFNTSVLLDEYSKPSTPCQKMARQLRRRRKLEQTRKREAVDARNERYVRRKGLLEPTSLVKKSKRIKWKGRMDTSRTSSIT